MTTKKSTKNELKEKLGLLTRGRKKEQQQKITATKQKLKNLKRSESSTKKRTRKADSSKQSTKLSATTKGREKKKSCSVDGTTGGNTEMLKKKKWIRNQLEDREIFENSKFEISNYHATGLSASITHTPLEVSLTKKGGDDIAGKKLRSKFENDDEDDTLFNVDPLMPDLDLPSLRLNAKTE
ncbi:unnamed protein product [Litomosoides sigmodontis]|uniref:Uncharacterized protein n=1 Tax=Litomosoides sigmodontis TaxID=42156 RepID=A0A3P6TBC0_LITSI|nr:unnamed protein product [Litomosoides sigmodontis]